MSERRPQQAARARAAVIPLQAGPGRAGIVRLLPSGRSLLIGFAIVLGAVFYTGGMFPEEYHNGAFVAFHGSWNRKLRTGYKVVRVRFKDGKPVGGYEDFLTGWMLAPDNRNVWGRPVGLLVAGDGALLVSDDGGHRIWRVSYAK